MSPPNSFGERSSSVNRFIFNLAFKELRNNIKFTIFFVFNLAIGMSGFVTLDSFRESLNSSLSNRALELLGADLAVEVRRDFTPREIELIRETIGPDYKEARELNLLAMVATGSNTRLVEIQAIEPHFPFYGDLELQEKGKVSGRDTQALFEKPRVWIYPELQSQLNVKLGETLKLGDIEFVIDDLVLRDSGQTFRGSSLAPRVYVGLPYFEKSTLTSYGATMSRVLFYQLPMGVDAPLLRRKLQDVLLDPAIHVDTPQTASEDTGRTLNYLADYLGLVALVGLFLSSLGSIYLFRSFLVRRQKEIAVLISLGLRHNKALQIYILQILILGFAASLVTFIFSFGALPVLNSAIQEVASIELQVSVGERSLLIALLLSSFGSLIVCLPILSRIMRLPVGDLFREDSQVEVKHDWKNWFWSVPAILSFVVLSIWQANSYKTGLMFVGALAASTLLLGILAFLFLAIFQKVLRFKVWYVKQAFLSLSRRRWATLACFLALGLGSLLMNLLPQLKVSLQEEMSSPTSHLPSLFLFDIQDEQIDPLKRFLQEKKLEMRSVSPMIRARILKVNGKEFEKKIDVGSFRTREEESEARFRNRGFNLSYRAKMSDAESLVKGKLFSGTYNRDSGELPEISVEEKFAERLGFAIGDHLIFDIQGIQLEGKIINLRKVKWTSFQPNFFVIFQPGVLEEAPKIWLGSISGISDEEKNGLQNELVQKFSNVSILDVNRTVTRVMGILQQMSWSLELMSALALFAGFVVLFSIASHQAATRRWDINMMKILGAGFADLQKFILLEFAFLGFIGALLGIILSFAVSFVMSKYIFDGVWTFTVKWPLITLFMVTTLSFLTSWFATRRVLREKPKEILSSQRT